MSRRLTYWLAHIFISRYIYSYHSHSEHLQFSFLFFVQWFSLYSIYRIKIFFRGRFFYIHWQQIANWMTLFWIAQGFVEAFNKFQTFSATFCLFPSSQVNSAQFSVGYICQLSIFSCPKSFVPTFITATVDMKLFFPEHLWRADFAILAMFEFPTPG